MAECRQTATVTGKNEILFVHDTAGVGQRLVTKLLQFYATLLHDLWSLRANGPDFTSRTPAPTNDGLEISCLPFALFFT